jgi:hypothetical protein
MFSFNGDCAEPNVSLFGKENLVAWCIVPFDAKKRGPAERAEMLKRLGIQRVAYDWRQEHVASFEEEILQYKKHGLEYFAFWSWHDEMGPLINKYGIRPQIWQTNPSPEAASQAERVQASATLLNPLVEKTRQLNCQFGLYNHGGWGGQPENLVAVCRYLRERQDAAHVGIVYNFHHGHAHINNFASSFPLMKPYLLCVNINGMANPEQVVGSQNKIVPVGSGMHERGMLQIVQASGYGGPIGILDHRNELDAEVSLRQNLDGLAKLVEH